MASFHNMVNEHRPSHLAQIAEWHYAKFPNKIAPNFQTNQPNTVKLNKKRHIYF